MVGWMDGWMAHINSFSSGQNNDLSEKHAASEWDGEPGRAVPGRARQREKTGTTQDSRSISAMEMTERGCVPEQMSGSVAVIFILKSCVEILNPPWTSQNKGEADDSDFSPFSALLFPNRPFRYCPVVLSPQPGRSFPGWAIRPLQPSAVSILAGHTSDYFWTHMWCKRFRIGPDATEMQNLRRQKPHAVTAEVEWSHFLNFPLYTMDAGEQDNKVPQNKTQGCAPKESLDSSWCWDLR